MLADLLALLDKPLVLLIVLTIGGVIGIALESALNRIERERRKAYWRDRNAAKGQFGTAERKVAAVKEPPARDLDLAADQLKAVIARNPGWQAMAQVSLGEFLASEDKDAYACINSKRVDFALMDPDANVRHALEYQGGGHHQGTAAARDAVKKEALRKAGIGYHEIVAGHTTPGELKRLVEKLVPGSQDKAA